MSEKKKPKKTKEYQKNYREKKSLNLVIKILIKYKLKQFSNFKDLIIHY